MCRNFHVDYLLSIELQYYDNADPGGEINTIWFTRLYDKEQGEPVDSVKISFKLDQEKLGEFDNIPECIRNSLGSRNDFRPAFGSFVAKNTAKSVYFRESVAAGGYFFEAW